MLAKASGASESAVSGCTPFARSVAPTLLCYQARTNRSSKHHRQRLGVTAEPVADFAAALSLSALRLSRALTGKAK